MPDAASSVDELTQRLADALRRAEAAETSLAEAQVRIAALEHALTVAGVALPGPPPPAAPAAASTAPSPIAPPAPTRADVVAETPTAPAVDTVADAAAATPAPAADEPHDPRSPELIARLDRQQRALAKRGFNRTDVYFHDCKQCGEHAVAIYGVGGKPGGRDIELCLACGTASSWRRRPDKEDREQDTTFDLDAFLKL